MSVALFACGPNEPPTYVYYEDFETVCDGAPCGWERSSGTADQATWVETIHPGEHALELTGSVGVRGPSAGPTEVSVRSGSIQGCVVARCDRGSSLQIDLLLEDTVNGLVVGTASVNPLDAWSDPVVVSPTLDATITDAFVTAVVITKRGTGVCEIGELAFEDALILTSNICR